MAFPRDGWIVDGRTDGITLVDASATARVLESVLVRRAVEHDAHALVRVLIDVVNSWVGWVGAEISHRVSGLGSTVVGGCGCRCRPRAATSAEERKYRWEIEPTHDRLLAVSNGDVTPWVVDALQWCEST
jgi:hypothetical protein